MAAPWVLNPPKCPDFVLSQGDIISLAMAGNRWLEILLAIFSMHECMCILNVTYRCVVWFPVPGKL